MAEREQSLASGGPNGPKTLKVRVSRTKKVAEDAEP